MSSLKGHMERYGVSGGSWNPKSEPEQSKRKGFASGGAVRGKQTEDDGEGGWADHDGTERPDGEPYKKGGRAEMKSKKMDKDGDGDCYASGGKIKPGFIKHEGSLRKALDVKEGEKIPEKKLEKAEHSDNPTLKKRAVLAETMKKWKK